MIDGNVEAVALGVIEQEVLAFDAPGLEADETPENANSVIDVDDVVAGRERRRQRTGFGMAAAMRAAGLFAKPEDLEIG